MAFVKVNNQYIGIEPFPPFNIALKSTGAGWEKVIILKDPNTPWYTIRAIEANRFICVNQSTNQLESRPTPEGWGGEWSIVDNGRMFMCNTWTLTTEGYQAIVPLPSITLGGNDFFINEKRTSLAGCDMFMAYRQWLDGGADALAPFIAETKELGFLIWRVFLQGSKSQNQVLELVPANEPNWKAQLRPFVTHCNSNGIIPLLTLCVDNQVIKSDLVILWNTLHLELKGLSYLASFGNELDKNGGNPNDCPNPGPGVWWSRGSRTQDAFYPPNGATAAEFHPVRNLEEGRTQMDAVASVFYMRNHGCGMLWLDESFPFDNDTPPHYGFELARLYSTYWAVVIFHNRQGQRGQLLGPGTKEVAKYFMRGMKLD